MVRAGQSRQFQTVKNTGHSPLQEYGLYFLAYCPKIRFCGIMKTFFGEDFFKKHSKNAAFLKKGGTQKLSFLLSRSVLKFP
ncbi:hypothetical protein F1542_02845 [Komagataeibacter sp. FXV3]|nr:hypothetical protein [Komagataeibacter sp. FXV3]